VLLVVADVVAAGDARLCNWLGKLETSWLTLRRITRPVDPKS
jgi:hypothetical protein